MRSWFDCFDGLPFGLVYHLGVWKISSCFATLFIAHQFWRNQVYKEIILELNDPIVRTMIQCFVTSNSPKTYSSFLSNQNDTWNIECNQVNRKTTWKHIWTIFCFDIKISRQIDIRVCQKASWCISVSEHTSHSTVFMHLYCFIGDEMMYGPICHFIYRLVFCQTISNANALTKFSNFFYNRTQAQILWS